jgi:TRAP-type C4-dicarboxylate transport system substrate-binding protein
MDLKRPLMATIALMLAVSTVGAQGARLKIATMAPDGSFWMNELRAAADEIERRTVGRVGLRFYPGGSMGSDDAVLRKMRIGQLQGGVLLAGGLATVDPNLEIYNLPLLFRNYDEVDAVRREMDPMLIARLAGKGYVAFGITETGFTYLMSAAPTRSFAELKGRKAWIPQDDAISLEIARAVGLSPVPLPISDVMTGLQTGLVDTVAAPPVGAIALQWFTKAPFVTDLPITYVCGAILISEKAFSSVGPADREIVREVLGRASAALGSRTRADNREAKKALVQQGVTFVIPSGETQEQWREIAAVATERLIAKQGYDPAVVARVRDLLADYRAAHPDAADLD